MFEHRGSFRAVTGLDSSGKHVIVRIDLANDPVPNAGADIYYTQNDVAYYRAWLESLYFGYKGKFDTLTDSQKAKLEKWEMLNEGEKDRIAEHGDPDAEAIRVAEGENPGEYYSMVRHLQGKGYVPKYIDERFIVAENERIMLNNGLDQLNNERATPFEIRERMILVRQLAADVFNEGGALVNREVPTMVVEFDPGTQTNVPVEDDAGNYIVDSEEISLLGGEFSPDPAHPGDIVANGIIPLRAYDQFQEDGTKLVTRDFLEDAADDSENEMIAAAARAVEKCYQPYDGYSGAEWKDLFNKWGMKDKRYSIGFHRSGLELPPERMGDMQLDHDEIVVIGIRGFNPYYTVYNEGAGATMIQKTRTKVVNPNDPDDESYEYELALRLGKDLPTFIFDKPIDGSGIMLVAGNLLIRDTFAYHGTMLVLGDVIVESQYKPERLLYGPDGNPYDVEGNSLKIEVVGGVEKYYFIDENNIRRDVAPMRAKDVPAESDFTGHLVFQGNLMARGKMRTIAGTPPNSSVEMPAGRMDIMYSDGARRRVEEALPPGKFTVTRLSWTHNDDIPAESIWQDVLDD
jgi:hypothetical protein